MDISAIIAKIEEFEQRLAALEKAAAPAPEPAPEPAPQVQGEGSVPQAGAHE